MTAPADVVAAEWLKARSVRSAPYTAAVVVASVVLSALWVWNVATIADGRPPDDPVTAAASGVYLVMQIVPLAAGVLGVLTITSEYATGTVRATMAAASRGRILGAKAIVVAAAGAVAAVVSLPAASVLGRAIMGDRRVNGFGEPLSELLADGLAVVVAALLGLGLGALLRSTAAAVVAVASLLFVLPGVAGALPGPWGERVGAVLLPNLPAQVGGADDAVLPGAVALAVMVAYAVVAMAAGGLSLHRRDL
ncbi:ABC-2 family transporter [Haloactinopolyspora alba]|uniref:ABC-2 family transporter n=1 Tax=Haloactinopolyspora alba TaxID=648780 RepID=A0A2P8DY36_9ACTN|nr:ABC transporter permease subunit [Haloactinopolyspora alba]PSL02145.1 ABC-2 family transporter [Haloactinopolyspora alba]